MNEHDTSHVSWFHEDDEFSPDAAETYNEGSGFGPEKYKIRPFREVRPGEITLTREELLACLERNFSGLVGESYVFRKAVDDLFGSCPEGSVVTE